METDMTQITAGEDVVVGPDFLIAEDCEYVYANTVRIGRTNWDISIEFGTIERARGESGEQNLRNAVHAIVTMNPRFAKLVGETLLRSVKEYEDSRQGS